ncbi:EpsG family protein [Providencia sp. R1]|nr:EpsG family protein [Providencia rettgeri]MCB6146320.1 EpsG family protein [Providencia rettgeri]UDQ67278.1 EpsG family protein [Providencia rettgeri]
MYDTSSNFFIYYNRAGSSLYNLLPQLASENFNIDYYYSIFIYTSLIFYFWLKPIYYHIYNNKNNKIYFFMIFLVIFSTSYRNIMDLNRTALSISIAFYYIYYIKYAYNNKLYSFIYIPISIFFHPISIFIFFLNYISYKISSFKLYLIYIITCLLVGMLSSTIMLSISNVISNYDNILFNNINYYLTNERWGKIEYSTTFLLRKIVEIIICVMIIYISFMEKINKKNNISNLIILIVGSCFIFIDYKTFFERFFLILNFFYLSLYFFKTKIKITDFILMAFIILYFFSINFLVYGKNFTLENNEIIPESSSRYSIQFKPLYYPSIYLLDLNNGYSDEYINSHSIWGKNLFKYEHAK